MMVAEAGNHGLSKCQRIQYVPPMGKHLFDVVHYFLIMNEDCIEVFAKRLLGDVVLRRPESTRHQDNVCSAERAIHSLQDVCFIVRNRGNLMHPKPVFVQFTGHPGRIRIHDLSNQYFIADGDDFDQRALCFVCFHQLRICPSPRTSHLYVVNSSRAIGPRACSFLGADADFGTKPELSAVGKGGGNIGVHASGIHRLFKLSAGVGILADNALAVLGAVACDVLQRILQA